MTEDSGFGNWGTLVGVVGGAALGYWAGRSSDNGCGCSNRCGCAATPEYVYNNGGFNSFEAGKTQAELTAGLNYTSQGINGVRNSIVDLSGQMSAGFQNILDRQFQMLVAENQSLKNEIFTCNALGPVKAELANIGCAVGCLRQNQVSAFKSVPLCTTCPAAATTTA
jgi:hypothetical protein